MNLTLSALLLVLLSSSGLSVEVDLGEVVFVILSQSNRVIAEQADRQRQELTIQLKHEGVQEPKIFDLHNDWTMHGKI